MARTLKTFIWTGNDQAISQRGHGQVEMLGAATSKAELMRINAMNSSELWNAHETSNPSDIATATAQPGVVYARPMNSRNADEWQVVSRYAAVREAREQLVVPAWVAVGATVARAASYQLLTDGTITKIHSDLVTVESPDGKETYSLLSPGSQGGFRLAASTKNRAIMNPASDETEQIRSRERARERRAARMAPVSDAVRDFRSAETPAAARAAAAAFLAWAATTEADEGGEVQHSAR